MISTLKYVFLVLILAGCSSSSENTTNAALPEELKPLEWMLGTWQDDSQDITVDYTWRPVLDSSFMVQNFSMLDSEDAPLSGWQLLGWDPARKAIRSWIFDSDGGFGESEWHQAGDTWYVNTVYTTADGVKGSATYVYKRVDDKSFLFSMESGDLGGTFLPNAGPYKFVRKS